MDPSVKEIETELIDLSRMSLSTLRNCDRSILDQYRQRMMHQIDSARANIGSSGPPGRVD